MFKFFIILLLFSFPVFSQTFQMGTDKWEPFRILDNNDQLYGIDIDILEYISKDLNLEIKNAILAIPKYLF